jgi:hypothetical protein
MGTQFFRIVAYHWKKEKGSSTNVFTETQAKSSLNRKKSNKKKTYQNK